MNAPKVMDKVNVCACTCARLSWGSEDLQLSSDFEPPSLIAPPPPKSLALCKRLGSRQSGKQPQGLSVGKGREVEGCKLLKIHDKMLGLQ